MICKFLGAESLESVSFPRLENGNNFEKKIKSSSRYNLFSTNYRSVIHIRPKITRILWNSSRMRCNICPQQIPFFKSILKTHPHNHRCQKTGLNGFSGPPVLNTSTVTHV